MPTKLTRLAEKLRSGAGRPAADLVILTSVLTRGGFSEGENPNPSCSNPSCNNRGCDSGMNESCTNEACSFAGTLVNQNCINNNCIP